MVYLAKVEANIESATAGCMYLPTRAYIVVHCVYLLPVTSSVLPRGSVSYRSRSIFRIQRGEEGDVDSAIMI